jgi:aspartate/methionine/tyrosine aminotransferase
MADIRLTLQSDYMDFAKFRATARFNLASSGVADCAMDILSFGAEDLALHGPNAGGYAPLVERIAARFKVDPACVVTPGGGCSFANHLALAALVAPGDEVVVEEPTYALLLSTLGYLQAKVTRSPRLEAEAWRLDPERVAAAMTPRTRLVVLTNLHNPSSALADDATIHAVADKAAECGAMVMVDEVYRELTFAPGQAQTAFRPDGCVVTTSSLTKAYGLSGLRCGWILAPAPLAQKMRRLNDLFGVHPPHVSERLAVVALDQLETLRERAQGMIKENRQAYREVLGGHPKLEQRLFDQGSTIFPRLTDEDGDDLFQRLVSRYETSLAPGRFFGRPNHVRIGLGGEPAMTRRGLERLAEALS